MSVSAEGHYLFRIFQFDIPLYIGSISVWVGVLAQSWSPRWVGGAIGWDLNHLMIKLPIDQVSKLTYDHTTNGPSVHLTYDHTTNGPSVQTDLWSYYQWTKCPN